MFKRVMFAVVGIPIVLVIFFCLPPIWLPIMFSVLSMLALHEVLWSTGFVKHARISAYSILVAGLIPFWVYFGANERLFLCGVFCYVLLVFCEALASKYSVTLEKMGGAFFFALMIPYFLSAFIRIKLQNGALGEFYILLPMVAAFCSDTFALFAGLAFGKHKLAPTLSPKKTVEGSAGGLLGAIVCCCIYGAVMQVGFHLEVNYAALVLYGGLGSIVSQIGDLSFSYIKRQYGLKDFGNIFPGHGGVLDRFDSVIFCAPLIEVMIWLLPAFTGGTL